MDIDELYQTHPELSGEVDNYFCTLRGMLPHSISLTQSQGMEIRLLIEKAIEFGFNLDKEM